MNRAAHLLLACLIAVAAFDPAVCSSAFSSGASHSPIYLYAHADPVNGIDPSGRMLAGLTVRMGAYGTMASMVYVRYSHVLNRAVVIAFEASTGNSVYLGGAGATVALRQGTKMGGVGWSTWQWIGNLLKGDLKKVGTKKELSEALKNSGWQANHLNQHAAFASKIPYDDGVSVALESGTHVQGSQHWKFHDALEAFWRTCRQQGKKTVTNAEYDTAMRKALEEAGFPPEEVNALAKLAEESRVGYGFSDAVGGLQPVVPEPVVGFPRL